MAKKFSTILREASAASRRAERERLRREREKARQLKEAHKAQELANAVVEVEEYNSDIEALSSPHKQCGVTVNWEQVQKALPPSEPLKSNQNEIKAKAARDQYVPTRMDKILRKEKRKQIELDDMVIEAQKKDEKLYNYAKEIFQRAYSKWKLDQTRATQILNGDLDVYIKVLELERPFRLLEKFGVQVEVNFETPALAEVIVYVSDSTVIPNEAKTLLKSGNLSVKPVPKTKLFTIYQDHVCSIALRVSREIFRLLPIKMLIVTVLSDLLNPSTGNLDETSILSILIPRVTMDKLNFKTLDPSDAMSNFVHHIKFSKTNGFSKVTPVSWEDLPDLNSG